MKKNAQLAVLAVIILAIYLLASNLFKDGKYEVKVEAINKVDKELGATIAKMKFDRVEYVSFKTHAYLFKRLEEQNSFNKKGAVELGGIGYNAKTIKNGYVLNCPYAPVNNNYHLVVRRVAIQADSVGKPLDVLSIKKIAGADYNMK